MSDVELGLPLTRVGPAGLEVSIEDGAAAPASWFEPELGVVALQGLASAEVRNGRSIVVRAPAGVDERAIAHLVVGPAIGLALHQRKRLVLHGSGVVVDGAAVVFVGDAGWGKSTTAAAFLRAGDDLITDDMALLEPATGGGCVVIAGPPWLKLWPQAVDALGLPPGGMEAIYPGEEKLRVRTPVSEAPGGHRLAGIYVMHPGPRGDPCRIEAIDRRDAFIQLTRHAYAASVLERTQAQKWHGTAVAEIVRQVPVRRLVVERDLGALDALIGLVRADIRSREGRGLARTSAS